MVSSTCDATKGEIDAEGTGEWMLTGRDGSDSVEDEAGRAAPDEDISMFDADSAGRVGAAEGTEEEGCG